MSAKANGKGPRSSSLKGRRRPSSSSTPTNEHHPMLKDEEANMDLAKPHIPSEIQDFLKEIAFPQHEDEEDEASERTNPYQQMKANIKSAKPRVNTGSFKGSRRGSRPKSHLGDGIMDSANSPDDPPKSPSSRSDGEFFSDADSGNESGFTRSSNRKLRGDGRFTEYEMAVLWSQFKDKFADGRMNSIQLSQMLRQTFPRCDSEALEDVVENIMTIFDPHEVGTVCFRDLMIAFSLTMRCALKDRLNWSFRLYDIEDEGKVDNDDLISIIVRLCEYTKSAKIYWSKGGPKRNRNRLTQINEDSVAPTSPAPVAKSGTPVKTGKEKMARAATVTVIEENLGNVKILSNKMSDRVGPGKRKRHHHHHHPQDPEKAKESDKDQDDSAEKAKEDEVNPDLDEQERERAKEVVKYLDADNDGFVSKDEFVQGCLDDEDFFGIAPSLHGDLIWGTLF